LKRYLEEGRIKVDPSKHTKRTTIHDPCNYGRKSMFSCGEAFFEEPRWITQQCVSGEFVDMYPNRMNNYCCGAGGGAWAMPYNDERIYYGRVKAQQIKDTEAELVIAPCHNCRDQIMKSLTQEYELPIETMYLWELVAESLVVEPWSEAEIEAGHAERDAQFERDGVELDDEDDDWVPPE
jgi:Fe-S oxidoreductase